MFISLLLLSQLSLKQYYVPCDTPYLVPRFVYEYLDQGYWNGIINAQEACMIAKRWSLKDE